MVESASSESDARAASGSTQAADLLLFSQTTDSMESTEERLAGEWTWWLGTM